MGKNLKELPHQGLARIHTIMERAIEHVYHGFKYSTCVRILLQNNIYTNQTNTGKSFYEIPRHLRNRKEKGKRQPWHNLLCHVPNLKNWIMGEERIYSI